MVKNKFQLKREQTYKRLLETGMEIFCEKGYSSTTLEDITSRAGYTKGAFYVHFKSKQELFFQLLYDQSFFFAENQSEETLPDITGSDLRSTVEYWARQVLSRHESSDWELVYLDFYLQGKHDEKVRAYYSDYHKRWIKEVSLIIEFLKKKGWVPEKRKTAVLARSCYDLIVGSIIHDKLSGEPFDPEEITETLVSILS